MSRGLAPGHGSSEQECVDCVPSAPRRPSALYRGNVPRQPRIEVPGGVFHVLTRGVRKQLIYRDSDDRRYFLDLVDHVISRFGWVCHTYCLMGNHYHLLIETPRPNLSAGMHVLNGRYAQRFNRRHAVEGHVFERRFTARSVESDFHVLESSRYIVLNPVRAGICRHPSDWSWSSYAAAVGDGPAPPFLSLDWLLSFFGRQPDRPAAAYRAFVADGHPTRAA